MGKKQTGTQGDAADTEGAVFLNRVREKNL